MKFPPLHLGLIPDHLLDQYGHVPVLKDELQYNLREVLKWTLAFRKSGVDKGCIVVSLLPADLQWIIIDTALMRCGAIHVPFHAAHDIALATGYFRNYLFIANDSFRNDPALHGLNVMFTSTLYTAVEGVNPALIQGNAEADVKPGDIATVVFSCDNDSVVKPFAISHENLVITGHHSRSVLTLNPGETYLSLLPFSKVYGRTSLLCHILQGCSIRCADHILLPSRLIKTSEASSVAIVPSLLQYPVKMDEDLSPWAKGRSLITIKELPPEALRAVFGKKLNVLICGGSMIPHILTEKFSQSNVPLMEGYGLTQTTGVYTVNTPSEHYTGSKGKPLTGMQIKISDEGEVLAKGKGITPGIIRPDGSVHTADNPDGWLSTGDEGYLNEDGFLFLTGNRKRVFKLANGYYYDPLPDEEILSEKLHAESMICRDEYGDLHLLAEKTKLAAEEMSFIRNFRIHTFSFPLRSVNKLSQLPGRRPYIYSPDDNSEFLR